MIPSDSLQDPLTEYWEAIEQAQESRTEAFVERRFQLAEHEGKVPSAEILLRGRFREDKPTLKAILDHPHLVIIGDAGSGKSVLLQEVERRHSRTDRIPIRLSLRSYAGDISSLLDSAAPSPVLKARSLKRLYLLDGLDELPPERYTKFAQDISRTIAGDPDARFIITARQAFFAEHAGLLPREFRAFELLDFDEKDIRRYVTAQGVDFDAFNLALEEAAFSDEVRNPLALRVTTKRFKDQEQLSPLRSSNLAHVVDEFVRTRPQLDFGRQQRALQMLAVTMEVYSRNELTTDEAKTVLTEALGEYDNVDQFLDELQHSILIRTTKGIAFQLPSYGEYLTAKTLELEDVHRLKELAFLPDGTPNDSWRNAVSYLVEMNARVRQFFVNHHPDWVLGSSAAAFSADEKDHILSTIIDDLAKTGRFLMGHPTLRSYALAKFVTGRGRERLLRDLASAEPHVKGNALVILGARRDAALVPAALELAQHTDTSDPLRQCALAALEGAGTEDSAEALLECLRDGDPLRLQVLDCIGTLASLDRLDVVLTLASDADGLLSGTFNRLRNTRSRAALHKVLRFIAERPDTIDGTRLDGYIESIIDELGVMPHDNDTVDHCVEVILSIEAAREWMGRTGDIPAHLSRALLESGMALSVVANVCQRMHAADQVPKYSADLIGRLVHIPEAEWLIANMPEEMIRAISWRIPDEHVRARLAEGIAGGNMISAEQRQWEQEERHRVREQEEARRSALDRVTEASEILEAMNGFVRLGRDRWPELSEPRRDWLAGEISTLLVTLDLPNSIVDGNGTSWSHPRALEPCLDVVDFYRLTLSDDRTIVQSLRSWCYQPITRYWTRNGSSPSAAAELNALLTSRELSPRVITNILSFLYATEYVSDSAHDFLRWLAQDPSIDHTSRSRALGDIVKRYDDIAIAETLHQAGENELQETARVLLVEQQHRPTIERELSRLIDQPEFLNDAERPFPSSTPLEWIGKIRSDFAWNKLKVLRSLALRAELNTIGTLLTETMKRIDLRRAAAVVKEQVSDCPESWRMHQINRAEEYEREARLAEAHAITFDRVIAKVKGNTSMLLLKLWCEGKTDVPIFDALLQKLGVTGVTVDIVGGWANLDGKDPQRLLDGCKSALVVMDGCGGRHLDRRRARLTPLAERNQRRLREHGIPLHVLERCGIENYLPCSAVEQSLNRNLTDYFPIPHWVSCDKHLVDPRPRYGFACWMSRLLRIKRRKSGSSFYRKELNADIAKRLVFSDISGTDLEDVMHAVQAEAKKLQKE